MVPSRELSPSREELLKRNIQIPEKTKREMEAGRIARLRNSAEDYAHSGEDFLRRRYADSVYGFDVTIVPLDNGCFDIELSIFLKKALLPTTVFTEREPAEYFISELMFAKIVMVCG